jgi:hypothetical protein
VRKLKRSTFCSTTLRSIVIPACVETIGASCFSGCSELESVEFVPCCQLRKIGDHAFQETSLQRILIPKHVEIIKQHAFMLYNRLQTVECEVSSKLRLIGQAAFAHLACLSKVTIPRSAFVAPGAFPRKCEITFSDPAASDDKDDQFQKITSDDYRAQWKINIDNYSHAGIPANSYKIRLYTRKRWEGAFAERLISFK